MTITVQSSDGVRLAVHTWGDPEAPTIVLVHGFPDTSDVWGGVALRLADRFHVVAYDVRGAGGSTAPATRDGYRLPHLVDDLAAVIDATSPQRPVHLVGHDWGSVQSWEAVTTDRLRTRIASFTSMSGPSVDHFSRWFRRKLSRPTPHNLGQLIKQAAHSGYLAAFTAPGAGALLHRTMPAMWPGYLERVERVPQSRTVPTLRNDIRNGRNLYAVNRDRVARPRAARTDIPVQLVVIAGDNYVTPALLEGIEDTAPNLHKRLVPGGHWLPRTHPDRVARWIGEFADHVEAGKRMRTGPLVVITGAGSGIGRATALAFAEQPQPQPQPHGHQQPQPHGHQQGQRATVVAVDVDGWAAERTAELARLLGAEAHARTVDVGDHTAMEELAKELIHDLGVPDIVINNAGIGMAGPLLQTTVEEWQRILHVNLWGVIHGSRVWGQAMVERGEGGHIVNVASAAAFTPSRMYPAYATTKAAVLMLTECLRAEVGDQGIGVSAICPGLVQTGIIAATRFVGLDAEDQQQRRRATDRFYRLVGITPDRVAVAIVDAVRRDRPLVSVGADAVAARLLSRFSPGSARRLARF